MSCCPPGAEGYLADTFANTGKKITLPSGLNIYVGGGNALDCSDKALIIFPDIFGWKSGRTRMIADYFASAEGGSYYTVVPQLLTPALEGADDNDGMPGNTDFSNLVSFMSQFTHEDIGKKLSAIMEHLGPDKRVAVIGFCYGGNNASLASINYPDQVKVGVICHPSFSLEKRVWGRDITYLPSKVTAPFLLMPAGNDPDDYRPGGSVISALQANNPKSTTIFEPFQDMRHGWVPRGDISDPNVDAAVKLALKHASDFFAAHI